MRLHFRQESVLPPPCRAGSEAPSLPLLPPMACPLRSGEDTCLISPQLPTCRQEAPANSEVLNLMEVNTALGPSWPRRVVCVPGRRGCVVAARPAVWRHLHSCVEPTQMPTGSDSQTLLPSVRFSSICTGIFPSRGQRAGFPRCVGSRRASEAGSRSAGGPGPVPGGRLTCRKAWRCRELAVSGPTSLLLPCFWKLHRTDLHLSLKAQGNQLLLRGGKAMPSETVQVYRILKFLRRRYSSSAPLPSFMEPVCAPHVPR